MNIKKTEFNLFQLLVLLSLRFLIGWHVLYEGVSKVFTPGWSAADLLKNSQWILSDVSNWIVANPTVLEVVDFLNVWGLIAIGAGVMLGFFFKTASVSGFFLLLFYYLAVPPLTGLNYSIPIEGSNLIINKTLIEAVALLLLAAFPTNKVFGLDYFLNRQKTKTNNRK